jgi:hypothetical protein
MRMLAWGIVVAGLVTGLAGQLMVIIESELLYRKLLVAPNDETARLAHDSLSLWPAVQIGAAIATVGFLLLVLRLLRARLLRRRIFARLVGSTATGSSRADDLPQPGC